MVSTKPKRASLLITTLGIATLVAMMTLTLLNTNRSVLGFGQRVEDDLLLTQLTRAAVNRCLEHLSADVHFASPLSYQDEWRSYRLNFDSSDPDRSVNNLHQAASSATTNCLGQAVPPHTFDLCVVAECRRTRRRTQVIIQRGLAFPGALGCEGRIQLHGQTAIDGILDLASRQPVPALFHSNASGAAVSWDSMGSFDILNQARLSAVGTVDPAVAALPANSGKTADDQVRIPIPRLEVADLVSNQSSAPAVVAGPGDLVVNATRYCASNLNVVGDINLRDGSLYVNGNVVIDGGVSGYGALYASGNITIRGGNASVITNQPEGASIFAGGDIEVIGQNAGGYLTALAGANPGLTPIFNQFSSGLTSFHHLVHNGAAYSGTNAAYTAAFGAPDAWLNSTFPAYPWAVEIWWAKYRLARGGSGASQPLNVASPNGSYQNTDSDAYITALRNAISALPSYPGDTRAQQIVRGLDELNYYMRHNWTGNWDYDLATTPSSEYSLDHQIWLLIGLHTPPPVSLPFTGSFSEADMAAGVRNYFRSNDPLNFSWLGRSYVQGVLYAQGDVRLTGDTTIYGQVLSHGDLSLTNSTVVYDAEYATTRRPIDSPARVVSWREL